MFTDGTEITVTTAQIADFGLYSGRELSDDEFGELRRELAKGTSKARAMRMLGSRDLSSREIEKRLINKGDSHETARETVLWLEKIGAVDDTEYAAAIALYYAKKGYGKTRIRNELFKRGIDRELWDEAMSGLDGMEDAVGELLKKKLKGESGKDDLRKAVDMLCRRGFSYSEAREAVNRYLEELGIRN